MTAFRIAPDEVFNALAQTATVRTRKSLEALHSVCQKQLDAGNLDFTIATIGKMSAALGGPATQSIRNKEGRHYRDLIASWETFAARGSTKKVTVKSDANDALLDLIQDASARALVGVILADNKRLRTENSLLKGNAQVIIDKRPAFKTKTASDTDVLELLPAELDALRDSLSTTNLQRLGLDLDPTTGRVSKDGRPLFKAGFAVALRKVIERLDR